jgi:hypothetical protein
MNPEIKQKWVDALRSGKYKQGQTYLLNKENGSYCCLGVLCEVVGASGWQDDAQLPPEIQDLTGVSALGRIPNAIHGYDLLSALNDSLKYDFNRIADIIEEQL